MDYYFEVILGGGGVRILIKAKDVIEAGQIAKSYFKKLIGVYDIEIDEITRTKITKVIE